MFFFQINSSMKEQWKLLLEQNSIGYKYPGDINSNSAPLKSSPDEMSSSSTNKNSSTGGPPPLTSKSSEDDWQIVIPINDNEQQDENNAQTSTNTINSVSSIDQFQSTLNENKDSFGDNTFLPSSGILPAARARLASLRDLGAKKIGALKLKLVESRMRMTEKGKRLFSFIHCF